MGRSRYKIIEEDKPHFVTCTTVGWTPLFSSPKIVGILFDSLSYLQENKRISIYAYVIMENHLHLIISSEKPDREIRIFKSFTARKIIDFLKERKANHILKILQYHKRKHKKDRAYQLWQEGSHPQAVTNEDMMFQKIEYIHGNPVKCGYVAKPEHWRYSSALNYTGMDGLLNIQRF